MRVKEGRLYITRAGFLAGPMTGLSGDQTFKFSGCIAAGSIYSRSEMCSWTAEGFFSQTKGHKNDLEFEIPEIDGWEVIAFRKPVASDPGFLRRPISTDVISLDSFDDTFGYGKAAFMREISSQKDKAVILKRVPGSTPVAKARMGSVWEMI